MTGFLVVSSEVISFTRPRRHRPATGRIRISVWLDDEDDVRTIVLDVQPNDVDFTNPETIATALEHAAVSHLTKILEILPQCPRNVFA